MPAPRFQHGFDNDLFVSYTHEDDREEAAICWVTRFEAELRARLAKVSGHSIQSWRDVKVGGADRFGPAIEDQLLKSAVLVSVITPSYFRSEWCTAERETFVRHAEASLGLDVGFKSRLVKAAKTRVSLDQYPQEFRDQLEFRFYVEESNDLAREFHLSPDERVQKRFFTVVDDMAQAIDQILRGLAGEGPQQSEAVYVGDTSSDFDRERERLRRSLTQRGYNVLPQAPLRLHTGPEIEQICRRDLAQCHLAVYPVGGDYGPIPERAGDRSITELQLEAALSDERNGALPRLVWLPPRAMAAEERQRRLLARIRTELPSRGFEVIEGGLTEIETHVKDRLQRSLVDSPVGETSDERSVYVLCVPADREAVRAVRDALFNEGFEVRLQPTSDEGAGALHLRRLETADAFLIYWGSADEEWLEPALTELKKAKGLRKGKPILSKAIFVADPATDAKRDFLTHAAMMLRGAAATPVIEALQPMLAELRRARPGAPR